MNTTDERPRKWLGPLLVLVALPMFLAKPSEGVPGWIVTTAAMVFLFGGLSLTNVSLGNNRIAGWFGRTTGVVLLFLMNGSAFFVRGQNSARTGFSIGGLSFSKQGTEGELLFQALAILVDIAIVIGIWQQIRRKANKAL